MANKVENKPTIYDATKYISGDTFRLYGLSADGEIVGSEYTVDEELRVSFRKLRPEEIAKDDIKWQEVSRYQPSAE
jgi:hypothetical protein